MKILKRLVFLGTALLALAGLVWLKKANHSPSSSPLPAVLGTPAKNEKTLDFDWQETSFRANWFEIFDTTNLKLIPNFELKLPAKQAFKDYGCQYLLNAGFYTKENLPVGLFISEYETLRDWQKNSFFNGVLSINDFATPRITSGVPRDNLKLAIQSGPLLIENAQVLRLAIKNDKLARRVVAATTGQNSLVFLVIYDKTSAFEGPLLNDLPAIIQHLDQTIGLRLADAINLDGGSASAFITDKTSLTEISPVGSFLCIAD
jgi:uncharacterized protein YigE (DUF2233 family)